MLGKTWTGTVISIRPSVGGGTHQVKENALCPHLHAVTVLYLCSLRIFRHIQPARRPAIRAINAHPTNPPYSHSFSLHPVTSGQVHSRRMDSSCQTGLARGSTRSQWGRCAMQMCAHPSRLETEIRWVQVKTSFLPFAVPLHLAPSLLPTGVCSMYIHANSPACTPCCCHNHPVLGCMHYSPTDMLSFAINHSTTSQCQLPIQPSFLSALGNDALPDVCAYRRNCKAHTKDTFLTHVHATSPKII